MQTTTMIKSQGLTKAILKIYFIYLQKLEDIFHMFSACVENTDPNK